MLIVYDTKTGEVLDNSGTNSVWPEGPPDDLAFVNTDARGIDRSELALLRLHDDNDAELIAQAMSHQHLVSSKGELVIGAPYPTSDPEPARDWEAEIDAAKTWEEGKAILKEFVAR